MKKSIMLVAAAMLYATTVSYSQTRGTGAGETNKPSEQNPNSQTTNKTHQGNSEKTSAAPSGGSAQAGNTGATDTRSKQAQQNTPGDGSTRPGGASNENANDVGRYSDNDAANEKSMLNSKKAVEARRKNLTEADTTAKKGSGSAPKNTKNHTGTTGNYQNKEMKHNQRVPTRP
ncbi:hypothetical protein DYBT9623_00557 [Dyadobacter sp. CECT 9623]|uniref:Uncharacterized protein n=1 Tax=Dyadobacter linearis TaxID=2823330 RepID=A0ABM8UK29_9BACT|nr:hypothetical protein [Dyadobacter sp. CECT 9623]CAG5067830.1 hypothetical protein DYBT9623_00557 [Dyadobacter sp. CECT 9623]